MEKAIEVKCTGTELVKLNKLKEFQEGIKSLSPENKEKLKCSIMKYGIIAPFFVWKNSRKKYLLDGHQRILVLRELINTGYIVPDVPVIYVQAETEQEAKEKLLQITSQYGDFELKQLDLFLEDIILERDEIRLMKTEINLTIPNFNPVDPEDQGQLDKIKEKVCPNCGYKFKG